MTKSRGIQRHHHPWTESQIQQLRDLYPDQRTEDLVPIIGRGTRSIYAKANQLGIRKSADFLTSGKAGRTNGNQGGATRFKPGITPWNKGLKGFKPGGRAASTQFKPGSQPFNTKAVGDYRIERTTGLLQRKIGTAKGNNSKRWRGVHELVWIEANGPMPPGHICVFKPGMRTTVLEEITADKVECISLAENMRRNSYHTKYPKEIGLAIQLRGALQRKINRLSRKEQHEHNDNVGQ